MTDRVPKASSIVLRDGLEGREMLVFDHPMQDGSVTVQVPAGTIEPGESPAEAAVRELHEETGLKAAIVALAGVRDEQVGPEARRRWIYLLAPSGETMDEWQFSCDCGVPTRCYWLPLESAEVVPMQQPWLDMARAWASQQPAHAQQPPSQELQPPSQTQQPGR